MYYLKDFGHFNQIYGLFAKVEGNTGATVYRSGDLPHISLTALVKANMYWVCMSKELLVPFKPLFAAVVFSCHHQIE